MKGFEPVTQEIVRFCKDLMSAHGLEVEVETGPAGVVLVTGRGEGYDQPLQVAVQVFEGQPVPDEADAAPYDSSQPAASA